jgi:hypothetical protein
MSISTTRVVLGDYGLRLEGDDLFGRVDRRVDPGSGSAAQCVSSSAVMAACETLTSSGGRGAAPAGW